MPAWMAAAARQTMPAGDAPPRSTTFSYFGWMSMYSPRMEGHMAVISTMGGPMRRPSISPGASPASRMAERETSAMMPSVVFPSADFVGLSAAMPVTAALRLSDIYRQTMLSRWMTSPPKLWPSSSSMRSERTPRMRR